MISSLQSINKVIEDFPSIIAEYSTKTSERQIKNISSEITRIKSINPSIYSNEGIEMFLKKRASKLNKLVDEYYTKSIASEFPLVDEKLLSLKRVLTFSIQNTTHFTFIKDEVGDERKSDQDEKRKKAFRNVAIPLCAYLTFPNEGEPINLGSFTVQRGDSYSYNYSRKKVNIETKIPGIMGDNIKKAYRDSMQKYFQLMTKVYGNEVSENLSNSIFNRPEIGVLWIPTSESFNLPMSKSIEKYYKQLEPAMVLNSNGKKYFIQTWKADDPLHFD